MRLIMVARLAVCAFLLFFAASYTRPAYALPDHEYDTYFYYGCGENLEMSGWTINPCSGGHYTGGDLIGKWKEESSFSCDPENPDSSYHVYENCNGQWVERSTLGDCQCVID